MTTLQPATDARYEFDAADRMRRALRVSGVSGAQMAEHLEVSRDTISNWINGRSRPRRRDLRLFALRTGFPVRWLESGELPDLDSNQEPAGIQPACYAEVIVLRPSTRQPARELPTPAAS